MLFQNVIVANIAFLDYIINFVYLLTVIHEKVNYGSEMALIQTQMTKSMKRTNNTQMVLKHNAS